MSMTFGEVLAGFKQMENDCIDNLAPLTGNEMLRDALVAWKSVEIEYLPTASESCEYKEEKARWNWLWYRVKCDVAGFGVVAGVRPQEAAAVFQRLRGLRLIYPDGTVNRMAAQYMKTIIAAKLTPKKQGRTSEKNSSKTDGSGDIM
jgi:hypothetical protein